MLYLSPVSTGRRERLAFWGGKASPNGESPGDKISLKIHRKRLLREGARPRDYRTVKRASAPWRERVEVPAEDNFLSIDTMEGKMFSPTRRRLKMAQKNGFSLVEMLVVVAILGVLVLSSYPSILNSLETRTLENAARDIMTSMQRAKILAVTSKLNHRVQVSYSTGSWFFRIEEENISGAWLVLPK